MGGLWHSFTHVNHLISGWCVRFSQVTHPFLGRRHVPQSSLGVPKVVSVISVGW